MAGLGTIVNVAGILAGCGVGLLLKGGLPKRLQDTISSAVGLCVVFVGITGALKGLMTINGGSFGDTGHAGECGLHGGRRCPG